VFFLFLAPTSKFDKLNCPLVETVGALVGNSIPIIPKLCQLAKEVGEDERVMRLRSVELQATSSILFIFRTL